MFSVLLSFATSKESRIACRPAFSAACSSARQSVFKSAWALCAAYAKAAAITGDPDARETIATTSVIVFPAHGP